MQEHVAVDEGIAFRVVRGAFIQVHRGKATADLVPVLDRFLRSPLLSPACVRLNLVEPRSVRDAPDEVFRRESARLQKAAEAYTRGVAWIVPSNGFVGAAARAVLGGIQMLSRTRSPQKIFAVPEEGADWLVSLDRELGHSRASLLGHLDELARALEAGRSPRAL
jgi:hypothetical protein